MNLGPVRLQLPLRLSIAFVPADPGQRQGSITLTNPNTLMDPTQEQDLHQQVATLFGQKPWALSFKTIPSMYLAKGGGFEDLAKVAGNFGVDVVALVSVDQIQFSSPRWYAWTFKQELLKGIRKNVQLVDKDGHLLDTTEYDPSRR